MMCEQTERPFKPSDHQLLVSGGERRYVQKIGIFDITRIAKAISIGLLPAVAVTLPSSEIASMHADVIPYNRDEEQSRFTAYMLRFPAIICRLRDGALRMMDGRKRVRQAIREGASEVRVALFAEEDARSLGLIDESRDVWKLVEATKDAPLEASDRDYIRDMLVAAEAYPSEGGRPALTPLQSRLRAFMVYYWNALIDCEEFIRKRLPQSALFPSDNKALNGKEVWARKFFSLFMQRHDLPFSLSYNVVKNSAASAIREVTTLTTRHEFKQNSTSKWAQMSPEDLVADRDGAVIQCLLTMKASFRLELEMSTMRHLYQREDGSMPIDYFEAHDEYFHRSVKGNRLAPSKEFIASRMGLEEQILATMLTGISMTLGQGQQRPAPASRRHDTVEKAEG